jgi:Tfp pilus assembly protein PilN
MALHLNLYHEIETQKSASRRDPLKIAGYILGATVAVFAAMYAFETAKSSSLNMKLATLKAQFDDLDPKAREAEKRENALKQTFETSDRFVKNIETRFYWAPVIEDVVKAVPREVQITKLTGTVQGEDVKKAQLTFDGIAAGADPRRVAEDLRQALVETFGKKFKEVTAKFRLLEEGTETVTLDGRSLPTATFGITISLQVGEEAPVTPPPADRGKKKRRA